MDELLHLFDRPFVEAHTSIREGELKLGQTIQLVEGEGDLIEVMQNSEASVAILLVPEDIGVRANLGRPGAATTWEPALRGICNLQDNYYLSGKDIMILGAIALEDLMEKASTCDSSTESGLAKLRELTAEVDDRVRTIMAAIYASGMFPIVIGGGHNNSFPNLAAWCDTREGVLSCINLDPHADYRKMEGRHSGNGFRYAHELGAMDRYAVVGLHEGYNSKSMVDELRHDPDLRYSTFEDITIRRILSFEQAVTDSLDFVSEGPFGIELDLDSIPGVPVSAATSTGFTLEQARHFVHLCASREEAAYLHICEGSGGLAKEDKIAELSKTIAALVADGVKAKIKHL